MRWLLYLRLITLTAGTLLPFFWMVVILGHRRQRSFERIFFFLCLALTFFCGSSLLALNAQLYYSVPPHALEVFAWPFLCLGLWLIPGPIVHLHVEYGALRDIVAGRSAKIGWLIVAYVPQLLLLPSLFRALRIQDFSAFSTPSLVLGGYFQFWLLAAVAIAANWQWRFRSDAPDKPQRQFHQNLCFYFVFLIVALVALFIEERGYWSENPAYSSALDLVVLWSVIGPLAALIREVRRFNFLQIGRQRNLIYAVFAVFLALLYLSLIRRASLWLEPYLPPEASAALLLFLPVVFFEPIQRLVDRTLRATAQREMDVVYRLSAQFQQEARRGDLLGLVLLIEKRVKEEFELQEVSVKLIEPHAKLPGDARVPRSGDESFSIYRPGRLNGLLTVHPHGAMLSGETAAGLHVLCEAISGSIDLCIVLEEKLQLERELAERERMALVGQMAASISHNLKNPLGSMKTILQVQMESAELPAALRGETQMVLDEINRLSGKLNQLLQFSRPGVRPSAKGEHCDIVAVAMSVAEVLCREAESRSIALELAPHDRRCEVACSPESANDILSNVVLNAIEAVNRDGCVSVGFRFEEDTCTVSVDDNGPGIAPELREKVVQPFFTTKPRGTGLGLAIVARRLEEIGGKLEIYSPVANERGTRFRLEFPLAPKEFAP